MKIAAAFLLFSTVFAAPAWAEAPPRLHFLEQQLASISADNPGNLGFAALDLESGELVAIEGDNPFPMASTVKVAVAANYLAQVEHGRRSLDDRIAGRSARSLMEAMLIHSDNYATDLLLRDLGGPRTLQSWLTQVGVTGLRVDRNIAGLLRARRDLKDIRDSSTPRAMVGLLKKIDSGELLQPWSRSYLLGLMGRCMTGKNRIRGLLPAGTQVQNKTGTLNGYASDVGFITLPNGRRIAIALFARYGSNRPYTIARAARIIYNGFLYASPQQLTSNNWNYQPNRNAAPVSLAQPASQ
ncbi:MAG TPA: serine hydrolase [Sphingomicrobium sp.]|jgi:beta-lactamase class A|nr:serine hydrolase [Sphingomicrobium sp.]